LDVVGGGEADNVGGRVGRGKRGCPRDAAESRATRVEPCGRTSELALVGDELRDDELPSRCAERLGQRQGRLEVFIGRRDDQHAAVGTSGRLGPPRWGRLHIQRRVLNEDSALELLKRGGRLDAELAYQQLARPAGGVQ